MGEHLWETITSQKREPMYCALCGLGYGEFMACEESDCGPLMTGLEINILCDFELLAKGQKP